MKRLVWLVLLTSCVSIRTANPPRQCDAFARWHDNPLSNTSAGGWDMPRIAWWAFYPVLTGLLGYTIERATPLNATASQGVSYVSTGILPHAVGYAMHRYPVSPDFAFDGVDRALPLMIVSAPSPLTKMIGVATWAAGVVALHCYASP